jgi:superfamily I DNA/RNA helicase
MAPVPHPSVAARLARLAPDQRAAATAPPGPVLCVAPAGSGKTTTLVARVAWLVDGGGDPGSVCIVAFNKRAAEELTARLDAALEPLGVAAGSVRVRTFHALGREILRDAGVAVEPLADRDELLKELFPGISRGDRGRLDLAFSRLKLDLRVTADEVATDPAPGPVARAFVAYERAVRESGGVDFDDLLVRALACLRADESLLARWRSRTARLLVDEAQDLDRTQLELALLLAAPGNDVFLVGDDDQTIYSWRLADVRRVLGLAAALPGLRRVDLETNYRCPPPVVARAVRLVEHNRERFAKRILAGSRAGGRVILAPDTSDDAVRVRRAMGSWPADESTRAVLARTNRELLVAVVAALDLRVPFRAPDLALAIEDPRLDGLLARAEAAEVAEAGSPAPPRGPLPALGRLRSELLAAEAARPPDDADEPSESDLATALLGWAAAHLSLRALVAAIAERRGLLAALRRDDAALTLATAHGTKGLEWDHVLVLADGFPGRRSVSDATEPERALEEERRLAYVAWTRARRSLTLLYDPDAPSAFLREAFDPGELAPTGRGPPV